MNFRPHLKKLQQLLPIFCLVVFFVMLFLPFWLHSQSYYFQDETEHITPGWLMNEHGIRLYKDFSTNHQPMPIFFSQLIESIYPYTTLYQLISWIRLSMYGFHFLFGLLIVWRFRWRGLVSVIFLNVVNYYFFGWQVLAESLAAPPLIYLFQVMLEKVVVAPERKNPQPFFDNVEPVILAILVFWMAFTLLPLWPSLALFSCWLLFYSSNRARFLYVGTGVLLTAGLFLSINPLLWYEETIYNNIHYFLPTSAESGGPLQLGTMLYPLQGIFHLTHFISWYFLGQVALIGIGIFLTLQKRSSHTSTRTVSLLLLAGMLLLVNNRVDLFPAIFYQGFHLFPLIAGMSAVSGFFAVEIFLQKSKSLKALSFILSAVTILSVSAWSLEPTNKHIEHHINYSPFQLAADALNTISTPGDTLLTGADGKGYVNIMANLPLADRQNFHLSWSYYSPKLRAEFEKMMVERPPTFIIFDDKTSLYWDAIAPTLATSYQRAKNADGKYSNLYILNEKIARLDEVQFTGFNQSVLEIEK